MRPLIGIACRFVEDSAWSPAIVGTRRGYVDGLLAAGALPLLIPPEADRATLRQYYELADGILLPGGPDLDPALYGEERHPNLGAVDAVRDAAELPLARWAVAERKPLLGICRGLQVLNVALGGTLYQDLGSQHPTSLNHDSGSVQQSWRNLDHRITIEPDTRLAQILDTTELGVNSLHHQAIKELAPGLRVTGCAPDGVIEAVETVNDAFAIAVQCHPEELWQATDPRWRRVFEAFVAAAGQAAQR